MSRIILSLATVSIFVCASVASAQGNGQTKESIRLTTEQLYYQQLEREEDPKTAVRRKAEFRAQQRLRRMAAARWYGLDNARPVANPTPLLSVDRPWRYDRFWMRPFAWTAPTPGVQTAVVPVSPTIQP